MKNPLLGTWKLVSFETTGQDGRSHYPLGENPLGYITYSHDGYMQVAMMKANRPRINAETLPLAKTEDKAVAAATYVSYCGRYETSGDTVIHHVEISLDPNMKGDRLERHMQLAGDTLTLTTVPFPIFGKPYTGRLVWKRV
jgi:hypothetical protein